MDYAKVQYPQPMDISVENPKGRKIVYTGKNGYSHDHELARKAGLVVGSVYTVENLRVNSWSSEVYLQEKVPPDIKKFGFNTVIFSDLNQ